MDGLIAIDKHRGPTSHDIVAAVRKLLRVRKAGHCGTLDPDASGVLLVTLGRATRLSPFLTGHEKSYTGTIRLGFSTDTYDASGRPMSDPCRALPNRPDIERALRRFEGEILQTPPPYSAKKVAGIRLYKLARAGHHVEPQPSTVAVAAFRLLDYSPPLIFFETRCSAGTYVRSLAHDLGIRLGCGAHLAGLTRTASGPFILSECVSLARLRDAAESGEAEGLLIPIEDLLPEFPVVALRAEDAARVAHGAGIPLRGDIGMSEFGPDATLKLIGPDGRLIALGRFTAGGGSLQPFLVLRPHSRTIS